MQNNPLKIITFSDLHARRDNLFKVERVLDSIINNAKSLQPDMILFAGDLSDGEVIVNASSPLYILIDKIVELSQISPVYLLQGTPSHDRPGFLDIFKLLPQSGKTIHILDRLGHIVNVELGDYLVQIFGVPGLTKSNLIQEATARGLRLSTEETNQVCADLLKETLLLNQIAHHEAIRENSNVINILLGHFSVGGCRLSTGQSLLGGDISIPLSDLLMAEADLYCLGHIHEPQYLAKNVYYNGSCFPCNWGEVGRKSAYYIEMLPGEIRLMKELDLPYPPMLDLPITIHDNGKVDVTYTEAITGFVGEVRVKATCQPEISSVIDKTWIESFLKDIDVNPITLKIEKLVETPYRARCETISKLKTNTDKLRAWGQVYERDIPYTVIKRLEEFEETGGGHAS